MATGSWSLRLREDTPRAILDLITPFSIVGIFPNAAPIAQADANVIASARYLGIVHRPGPQLDIGGPGMAAWLGQDDICYDVDGLAVLPETAAISTAGSTLNAWLDDIILPGTPFTRGTTGPAGTMKGSYQYVTPRDVLEAVAAHFGAEWRLRGLTLDVAAYTTLYGSMPTVVISRSTSGRDLGYTSVQGRIDSALDVSDYASRVVVLGSSARAASGSSSPYTGPENVAVKATRVISAPDIPTGSESAVAATYVALFNSLRREVRLSTAHFDVSGDIGVGSLVYLFDPETGIVDTANVIQFRGETIRPAIVRCVGLSWPVRQGYGVALRTPGTTPTWTDLTPYIQWEDGDAEIEIGAAQQFVQGDALGLRQDLQPRLAWAPWQTYAVELRGTTANPTNWTLTGRFRRLGTQLEVQVTGVAGATSTFGAGNWVVTMPPNAACPTLSGLCQVGEARYVDASGSVYIGSTLLFSGDTDIYLAYNLTDLGTGVVTGANVTPTAPFTWANTDSFSLHLVCQVDP